MPRRKKLGPIASQFICLDEAPGRYQICWGRYFASSLTGFLAGVIATSLLWLLVIEAFFK